VGMKKEKKNNHRRSLIFVLGTILWLSVIFLFSAEPNLRSPFSYGVDLVLRKIAHITEYIILTVLVWKAVSSRTKNNLLLAVFLIVFSAAVLDECHQLFVMGREGSLRDVLFDAIGIISAIYFISRKEKNEKR
jgi:VanZ family protein